METISGVDSTQVTPGINLTSKKIAILLTSNFITLLLTVCGFILVYKFSAKCRQLTGAPDPNYVRQSRRNTALSKKYADVYRDEAGSSKQASAKRKKSPKSSTQDHRQGASTYHHVPE